MSKFGENGVFRIRLRDAKAVLEAVMWDLYFTHKEPFANPMYVPQWKPDYDQIADWLTDNEGKGLLLAGGEIRERDVEWFHHSLYSGTLSDGCARFAHLTIGYPYGVVVTTLLRAGERDHTEDRRVPPEDRKSAHRGPQSAARGPQSARQRTAECRQRTGRVPDRVLHKRNRGLRSEATYPRIVEALSSGGRAGDDEPTQTRKGIRRSE